jgi:hypothetical protein
MIFLDSRYADARLYKSWDNRINKQEYHITIRREWPTYVVSFFFYEWVETDRLDLLANKFLGNSELWWQILDINPQIIDPLIITPGTQIRIPNV